MAKKKNTTEYQSETAENAETSELKESVAETSEANTEENAENTRGTNALPPNVVELKSRWWLTYVITAAVLAVFVVLICWATGVFTETSKKLLLLKLCDAFFIPGFLGVGFGLIIVVSNGGAFDMLAYAFKTLGRIFKKNPVDRKYGSYYGYREARKKKKRSFWYLIIVGAAYLVVGAALFAWYWTV